ncbi:MAG: hypothetical protein AAB649_04465 [Patescibacteria group bacterium]
MFSPTKKLGNSGKMGKIAWSCLFAGIVCCSCLFARETLPNTQANTPLRQVSTLRTLLTFPSPVAIYTKMVARSIRLKNAEKAIKEEEKLLAGMKPSTDKALRLRYLQGNKQGLNNAKLTFYSDVVVDAW